MLVDILLTYWLERRRRRRRRRSLLFAFVVLLPGLDVLVSDMD
jgi:hypothetical protein